MDSVSIEFPPELPITAKVADIAKAIDASQVVIVAGATGSGKTTQLPKIALAMGRGLEKLIGVTQPRRIAATSVAARVAEELGSPLGSDVGYQIRFDDRTSPRTYVKFMTDGILLAEIEGDPLLQRYDTLVIDEAHERSLTIDFLLGWLKRILPERPDLKVVISSATIETERFSELFGGAPVIQVEGRTFPVEVLYEPPEGDADLVDAVASAVENVTSLDPRGDILVFLPGEREIKDCENELNARRLKHTVVQPLYARLSAGEQQKVWKTISERRVILATNVAETSVTIPGIVYVVDPGLARLSRYDPRSGTTRLHVEGISQASAEQRKGRCGRVRDGICVRLYDEQSFTSRSAFTDPEIKRTGLAGVILRMKSLGLGEVDRFPFLDPPSSRAIQEGYRVLEELGALDDARELTPLGRRLARFPVDPRIGRMIFAGAELGVLREVLVVAAALNVQDPRERPREQQQKADDAHRRFKDDKSDFAALLRLWDFVRDAEKKGRGNLRRVCKEGFLSYLRVREWTEIHRQLEEITRELKIGEAKRGGDEDALHRALLTGLLSKIGQWSQEARMYVGAKQTRFAIHPSSALAKKPPAWVMAFELVETSQLFARMVARIDPHWLADAAPHLLKRSYSDPHWSEKSARAVVKEHATLFGLTVAKDRTVDYASVAPLEARRIFIDHALVRGEYKTKGAFSQKNGELLLELARLRDKARKSDMLADDDALFAFFDARVPESVAFGRTFEEWREQAEKKDEQLLVLSLEDVLVTQPDLVPADYPDTLTLHGTKLPLAYTFDPAADDDGVTLTVPLVLVPQLDPGELDWTIPGWHREKIEALLYELPKAERRALGGDIPSLARAIAPKLTPFEGPMLPALAELAGVPASAFRPDAVARHLRLFVRVVDAQGRELARGRDAGALVKQYGARARAELREAAAPAKPRTGFTSWTFGDLEPYVVRRVGGVDVRSYPAIVDKGATVDVELLESSAAAEEATHAGLRRLFAIASRQTLSQLTPRLPSAFARPNGAGPDRAETDAFRAHVVSRIVDLAFDLEGATPIPRTAAAFDARLKQGLPRLAAAAKVLTDALAPIHAELNETLAAIRSASRHPSGRLALLDIEKQLEHLFPPDLALHVPIPRLGHYPRYLKAARARLQRAIADPRKDADKHAPFAPLWTTFLARKDRATQPDLRWMFEELRVAIFAPELKTPSPVSVAKVKEALASRAG
ncbi:MAG: ATP-dependent RNA helicase HrpA [Labilithrix sp.]|nr:ATP-dependent RNA helicase HrpA [Labilithrix sp.]MCW5815707.1 ATP-dependent RNA helicase HrpA [Labilithrix sp.]